MVEIPSLSIESVFGCIPPDEVDNLSALARLVGAAKAESIVKATGFATRRVAAPGVDVFDLALPAARRALEGVRPEDVGGVVSVTFSHRDRFPALAVRLQNALGLQHDIAARILLPRIKHRAVFQYSHLHRFLLFSLSRLGFGIISASF